MRRAKVQSSCERKNAQGLGSGLGLSAWDTCVMCSEMRSWGYREAQDIPLQPGQFCGLDCPRSAFVDCVVMPGVLSVKILEEDAID